MLTLKEMDKIQGTNIKNGYGISDTQLKSLITRHRTARKNDDIKAMEKIEYQLTDINFHSECGMLQDGEYKKAYETLENW